MLICADQQLQAIVMCMCAPGHACVAANERAIQQHPPVI